MSGKYGITILTRGDYTSFPLIFPTILTKSPLLQSFSGANEETLTLVGVARELAKHKNGANEETLTLDLFLGKEAL